MAFLEWLYTASSTILVLFYWPQMAAVFKAKTELKEISLLTWGIWTVCICISFSYSLLIAKDGKIALFSLLNAVCCGIIFAVTLYKRRLYARTKFTDSDVPAPTARPATSSGSSRASGADAGASSELHAA